MRESRPLVVLFQAMDLPLLAAVVLLFFIGVASIYSAAGGAEGQGSYFALRQLLWGLISCVAFCAVFAVDLDQVLEHAYWIYGAVCAVLVLVLLLGLTARGARSWLSFGFMNVQPSEVAKIALALVLARQLSQQPPLTLQWVLAALALGGVSCLLVLLQPDLGSVLVYCFMIFAALVAAGCPGLYATGLVGLGLSFLPVGWTLLKDYQRKRLLVFLQPSLDPLGAGYNVIQSRIAVGSGRWLGKGFMGGTQSKLRFLPEPHTDFIFSVYAEEFGFIGDLFLLGLYLFVLWRMITIALNAKNASSKIWIAALTAGLWFQFFEAVAMSMGLMPVTGLPMPLMSYGGSSLLSTVVAVASILKIGALNELDRLENAIPDEPAPY